MFWKHKKSNVELLRNFLLNRTTMTVGIPIFISAFTGIAALAVSILRKNRKNLGTSGVYGAVAVAKAFKGADFPMSKHDILSKYVNKEIEYHLGKKEKLGDILQSIPEQTYNRTTEIEHVLHEVYEKV